MLDILLLSALMVFIIDISGVMDSIERAIAKWLNVNKIRIPKPFSCSLCMSWWVGIAYCIIMHSFTISWIAYVALIAFLTPVTYNILTFVRDLLNKIIDALCKLIHL